ncbi:bacterioferritin [Pseudoalteromonas aurantia]|uniref:Bacterioferritin n=1 Tax=Pseudoalteromonas aurantia TaxID=43654 RepID=A0A5S3UVZ0_9GAMM|nr:bacterioferritin [Pseudoalteromonas aurantia]TMO56842.1 bacterioferritin [Pseudoalteromonas aurantia]TMO61428.1 bacterioferritin [Pseudoalteromonas aurantia]TMO71492.1 bacterioferritin [Pseudoalteromonas aurantia]
MQGSKKIIDLLNKQLTLELTSMDQYLAHSKIYEDWGLEKLGQKLTHEFDEELDHAKAIIERILFLEGQPDTASREAIHVGDNVQQMLENDLAAEMTVAASLVNLITECEKEKDYVTREILETLLDDTETDHIYWLEQHLGLIKLIGLQNYIQSQMNGDAAT